MSSSPTPTLPDPLGAPLERSFSPRLDPNAPFAPHFEPPRLPNRSALEAALARYAEQLPEGEREAMLAQQQLALALNESYHGERDRARIDLHALQVWLVQERGTLKSCETDLERALDRMDADLGNQVVLREQALIPEFEATRDQLQARVQDAKLEQKRLETEQQSLASRRTQLEAQAVEKASRIGQLYDPGRPERLAEPPRAAQIEVGLLVAKKRWPWVWAGLIWSGLLSYGLGLLSAASIFILLGGSLDKVTRALQLGNYQRIPFITLGISLVIGLSLTGLVAEWIGKLGYHWGLARRMTYHAQNVQGQDKWRTTWLRWLAGFGVLSIIAVVLLESTLGHEGVLRDLLLSNQRQQALDSGSVGQTVPAVQAWALWVVAVMPMVVLTLSKWVSWASKAECDVDAQKLSDLSDVRRLEHLKNTDTQEALRAHGEAQAAQAPLERAGVRLGEATELVRTLEQRYETLADEQGRRLETERARLAAQEAPRRERLTQELSILRLRLGDLEREEERFRLAQGYALEELHQAASAHGAQVTRRIEAGLPKLPVPRQRFSLWGWLRTLLTFGRARRVTSGRAA